MILGQLLPNALFECALANMKNLAGDKSPLVKLGTKVLCRAFFGGTVIRSTLAGGSKWRRPKEVATAWNMSFGSSKPYMHQQKFSTSTFSTKSIHLTDIIMQAVLFIAYRHVTANMLCYAVQRGTGL